MESEVLNTYTLRSGKKRLRENTEILSGIQTVGHKSEVLYYTKTVSKLQKFSVFDMYGETQKFYAMLER